MRNTTIIISTKSIARTFLYGFRSTIISRIDENIVLQQRDRYNMVILKPKIVLEIRFGKP